MSKWLEVLDYATRGCQFGNPRWLTTEDIPLSFTTVVNRYLFRIGEVKCRKKERNGLCLPAYDTMGL